MKKQIILITLLIAFNAGNLFSQNREKIRKLIESIPAINVSNESTDPNGDILTPKHSIGFFGTGQSRVERFEEQRSLTKQFEKFVAFNPNSDVLYPGSLVQGESLPDGVLDPINSLRTSLTITITDLIANNAGSYSKKVESPSLQSVTDATREILNQNLSAEQPAKITYSETSISSVEEGFLKLGASFKWFSGSVSGSFQTSTKSVKTTYMVRLVQSYYTVSCNAPSNPVSFISPKETFQDFSVYAHDHSPPSYISSVTYGRELWMLIESNSSESDLKSTLDAAFSSGFTSGSATLSTSQTKILNESNIQIMTLGGGGSSAINVIAGDHISALKSYLIAGANYSKTSPGAIISYTVRYLKDNKVARVSSTSDYIIKTDQAAPETILLTHMRITWQTTGDDKDWNTQPRAAVFDKNGRLIGHIECCSSDRNSDNWGRGANQTRDIAISGSVKYEDIKDQGRFNSDRVAKGHDDWDYTAIVELTFSNGERLTHQCNGRNSCAVSW